MSNQEAIEEGPAPLLDDPEADIQLHQAKANGNRAETWVQEEYDLDPRDPDRFPESCHDVVDPRTGRPGEVKSCQIYYNHDGKRGRFQIWDYAHELLLKHDGFYIFVVQEPRSDEFHAYFHRPLSASQVDERIGSWYEIDHRYRPDGAKRTSLGQSAIFTDITVERIEAEENGEFDADVIETPSQNERIMNLFAIIQKLETEHPHEKAPISDVLEAAEAEGIDRETAQHEIEQMRKRGDVYEPGEGHLRTVGSGRTILND